MTKALPAAATIPLSRPIPALRRRAAPRALLVPALALLIAAPVLLAPAPATAKPWWLNGSDAKEGDFLDPDVAFKSTTRVDGDTIHVAWTIADGYYLYRSRFRIEAESPGLTVDPAVFPRGSMKLDPYLGSQEIFKTAVEATVHYHRSDAGAHPLQIRVTYQGCAEAGLCYPPIVKVLFPGTTSASSSGPPVATATPALAADPVVPAPGLPLPTTAPPAITAPPGLPNTPAGGADAAPAESSEYSLGPPPSQPNWVAIASIGGALAFLIAGFVLRRGRRLDFPGA